MAAERVGLSVLNGLKQHELDTMANMLIDQLRHVKKEGDVKKVVSAYEAALAEKIGYNLCDKGVKVSTNCRTIKLTHLRLPPELPRSLTPIESVAVGKYSQFGSSFDLTLLNVRETIKKHSKLDPRNELTDPDYIKGVRGNVIFKLMEGAVMDKVVTGSAIVADIGCGNPQLAIARYKSGQKVYGMIDKFYMVDPQLSKYNHKLSDADPIDFGYVSLFDETFDSFIKGYLLDKKLQAMKASYLDNLEHLNLGCDDSDIRERENLYFVSEGVNHYKPKFRHISIVFFYMSLHHVLKRGFDSFCSMVSYMPNKCYVVAGVPNPELWLNPLFAISQGFKFLGYEVTDGIKYALLYDDYLHRSWKDPVIDYKNFCAKLMTEGFGVTFVHGPYNLAPYEYFHSDNAMIKSSSAYMGMIVYRVNLMDFFVPRIVSKKNFSKGDSNLYLYPMNRPNPMNLKDLVKLTFDKSKYYTSPKLNGKAAYVYLTGYTCVIVLEDQLAKITLTGLKNKCLTDLVLQCELIDHGTYYDIVIIDVLHFHPKGCNDLRFASFESRLSWMKINGNCWLQNYDNNLHTIMFSKEGVVFTGFMSNILLYKPGGYKHSVIGSPTFYVKIMNDPSDTRSVLDFCATYVKLNDHGFEYGQREIEIIFDDEANIVCWKKRRDDRNVSSAFRLDSNIAGYSKLRKVFNDYSIKGYLPTDYGYLGDQRRIAQFVHFKKVVDVFFTGRKALGDLEALAKGCQGHVFLTSPHDCDVCSMCRNFNIGAFQDLNFATYV